MTLRVILQIVPFGDEDRTYEIGRLDISNFGTNAENPNTYDYAFKFENEQEYNMKRWVRGHPRSEGAWALVKKVLNVL